MRKDMSKVKIEENDIIAVWFSCGAASAVAAKLTLEKYGDHCDVRLVNNPVANEHEDNLRFLKDCEEWLGVKIEFATNHKYPSCDIRDVFDKKKYMAGHGGAPCTVELKKEARKQWEDKNTPDWHVLGFTLEERHRYDRFILTERQNLLPILIERNITKAKCFEILDQANIKRPHLYDLGFPNANCIGCVKGQYAKDWLLVKKNFPKIFKQRAEQSRRIGAKLWKISDTERRFLDELTDDYEDDQQTLDFECGIFCEERI
jgi:3'-phosphoadenosine 5'-phosphosulfate sulfotransferase (PAPS reductase)/FAD synthetase